VRDLYSIRILHMETKEQLINSIKQWVKIDNEIRALQKEQVARKKMREEITKNLMQTMQTNSIDCFDIKDGKIMYCKKNVKKAITNKMLMNLILQYYQGDELKAQDLNNYILENREVAVKESIVRKIKKDSADDSS
jgi:hypothetical protein